MARNVAWLAQYGIAILLAVVLGGILGSVPLFEEASLGSTELTASHLVQFIGYGGALFLLWVLGQRLVVQILEGGMGPSFLHHLVMPFFTLIITSASYKVLLFLCDPYIKPGIQSRPLWF